VEANAPGSTGHSRPIAHTQRKETAAPARTYTVSLTALKEGTVDDSQLPDGSVVMVEKKPAQTIQVIGLVSRPDRYAYPPGQELRMLDAIALAKGISSKAADKVLITRAQGDGADPVVIVGSIRNAQKFADANLRLQPGDVVSVEQTPATVFVDLLYLIRFNSPLTAFF
jgi:polysaccharide export outer membrane protein